MSNIAHSSSGSSASMEAAIHNQALEWMVIFWSGEVTDHERSEWRRWLDCNPHHLQAWQQVQSMDQKLKGLPATFANQALRAAPKSVKRRKLLQIMGVMLTMGVTAQLTRETSAWKSYTADYKTGTGERHHLTLADGTRVSLNTNSAIDVRYTDSERRIFLREGELLITTAKDISPIHRPFIVETAYGTARALGTRFNIRQFDNRSRVAVFEGAVEIIPDQQGYPFRLNFGQQMTFSAQDITPAHSANSNDNAWLDGFIIAERMRLADFLDELSRYRPGLIRCDDAAADIIVSGAYPLEDTDRVLHSLSHVLPIRIGFTTRYLVNVSKNIT